MNSAMFARGFLLLQGAAYTPGMGIFHEIGAFITQDPWLYPVDNLAAVPGSCRVLSGTVHFQKGGNQPDVLKLLGSE